MKTATKGRWWLRGMVAALVVLAVVLTWKTTADKGSDTSFEDTEVQVAQPTVQDAGQTDGQTTEGENLTNVEAGLPEELVALRHKPLRADVRRRIEAEMAQLPRLAAHERQHRAFPAMGSTFDGDAVFPEHHHYGDQAHIVDYRETFTPAALRREEDPVGTVKCEWLLSLFEDDLLVIHTEEDYAEYADGRREYLSGAEYSGSQISALLKSEVSLLDFNARLEEAGLEFVDVILTNEECDSLVVINIPQVDLDAVAEARAYVEDLDMCRFVEVDSVMRPSKVPNDTYYGEQWWLQKIGAPTAWNTTTGSASVLVGVVGSGVSWWHSDLEANLWKDSSGVYGWNSCYGGALLAKYQSVNDKNILVGDWDGHETHVAGIIGGVSNNGAGVSGVNWNVKIVNVKYDWINQGTSAIDNDWSFGWATDCVSAWEYCRQQGCKIINFSSGGFAVDVSKAAKLSTNAINTMSVGVDNLRNYGVILVCAAGNSALDTDSIKNYPSSLTQDNIVSVAATDANDNLTDFSCYGKTSVDIAAPGKNILSTCTWLDYTNDGTLTIFSYNNNTPGYEYYSGTSMAAPIVTGALALLKAKYPNYTYTQLINRLYEASDKLSSLNGKVAGGRRVSLAKLFSVTSSPTNVKATQGTSTSEVTVSWSAVSGASYYQVYRATSADAADSAKTILSGSIWISKTTYSDTSATPGTTYYYWVKAATSSAGANPSAFSSPAASGWRKKEDTSKYPDQWDPADNTLAGAPVLTPTTTKQTHGQHGLVRDKTSTTYSLDEVDYFKVYLTAGKYYVFESATVGGSSEAKDLFAGIFDPQDKMVAFDDDSGDGCDFKLVYKARESGYHYLLVMTTDNTPEVFYNLKYYIGSENDRVYHYMDYKDIPAAGDSITVKCNSTSTMPWIFELTGRPSWVSSIVLNLPNGSKMTLSGTSTTNVSFEGEATLVITIAANTTTSARSWETFNVIPDEAYRLRFYQQAASALAAPTNVQASDGNTNGITVTWNAVSGATHYRVARASSATGEKTFYAWQTGRTYTDTTATVGATYWYWVQAATSSTGASASAFSAYDTGTRGQEQAKYKLTVTNGTGGGDYVAGQKVTIKANNAPVGKVFSQWTGNVSYLADATAATTTVTMPAKAIAVTAEYSSSSSSADPFEGEEPVPYPQTPAQVVYVKASFDGLDAASGDWLAAYCGKELRGKSKIGDNGGTWLVINTAKTGETICFVGYDASTEAKLECVTTIVSKAGDDSTYTTSKPLVLQFNNRDPFGAPVPHPECPALLVTAKVTVNGAPAEIGDIVAVKCGNELRGRVTITSADGLCNIPVARAKSSGEVLTFLHWNSDTDEVRQARFATSANAYGQDTYTTVANKDELGTNSAPVYLLVTDEVRMTFNFVSGWNAFSLNVATGNCTIQQFFGNNFSKVKSLQQVGKGGDGYEGYWSSTGYQTFTTMEPGKQYWVNMSAACTVQWDGLPISLDDKDDSGSPYNEYILKVGWNSLPYLPQNDSELKQTLAQLFRAVTVERVTSSAGGVYMPGNTSSQSLTTMKAGEVYWVRITAIPNASSYTFKYSQPTADSTRGAMALQSALSATYPEEWIEAAPVLANDNTLNRQIVVSLDYFGSADCRGVSIAAFRVGDDAFLGKAEFIANESSQYLAKVSVTQEIGTEVYFKLWDGGAAEAPYDTAWVLDGQTLVLEDKDEDGDGQQDDLEVALTASGDKPRYKIEFVLDDGDNTATQTDTTALVQYVVRGEAATPPAVKAPEGYAVAPWNEQSALYTNVRRQAVVQVSIYYNDNALSFHSADLNGNWKIEVEELNRVVALYLSLDGYSIDAEHQGVAGYDGFKPGAGDRTGDCHSADLNGNWKIDVEELNRVIALYLSLYGYEVDEGVSPDATHDGYKAKEAE